MRILRAAAVLGLLALLSGALAPGVTAQEDGVLDPKELDALLSGLGYGHKDIGSSEAPSYEFRVDESGLTIYVAASLSRSHRYLWLVTSFGEKKEAHDARALLARNAKIQPCHFFLDSKGGLKCALPVENRGLGPVRLRTEIAALAKAVVETRDVWAP
jgi:hypothetical protein